MIVGVVDSRVWTSEGYMDGKKFIHKPYKYVNDDQFFVEIEEGRWVEAQSIDFIFV